MKTKFFICLCVLFAGVMLYSCSGDDVTIKQKIEQNLQEEGYPQISVSVLNGAVTLTGTVENEQQKAAAGEIAKGVKYVGSVANNIFVAPEEKVIEITPDEAFTTIINEGLQNEGYSGIVVTVMDSVVTLKGEAKRADVSKIMQIANDANPKQVVNELTVK